MIESVLRCVPHVGTDKDWEKAVKSKSDGSISTTVAVKTDGEALCSTAIINLKFCLGVKRKGKKKKKRNSGEKGGRKKRKT